MFTICLPIQSLFNKKVCASENKTSIQTGRLAQPCFWHVVGQRALEHLLGWEREGYANCTLVAAEAAKNWGGHLTAL